MDADPTDKLAPVARNNHGDREQVVERFDVIAAKRVSARERDIFWLERSGVLGEPGEGGE